MRGYQIRANDWLGQHVATYQTSIADGILIAAASELLDLLDDACRTLDACEKGSSSHCTADRIRGRLAELGLWKLGNDAHGHPSDHEDPSDLNPEIDQHGRVI